MIFELGLGSGFDVPMYNVVGFEESNSLGSQEFDNDVSYKSTKSGAQFYMGTKKYPDASFNSDYPQEEFSGAFDWNISRFGISPKDLTFQF